MRTFVFLAFSFVVTLGAFAGGTHEKASTQATPNAQASSTEWSWQKAAEPYRGQTLHVLIASHPAVRATLPFVKDFESMTGIRVQIEQMARRPMDTKEEAALSINQGAYDITHIAPDKISRYVDAGWAEPLDTFMANKKLTDPNLDINDFMPVYLGMVTYHSRVYGLPYSGETNLLYYRTDIFKKYGISEPPSTIPQLFSVCAKINTKEEPCFVTRAQAGQGINVYTWAGFLYDYGGKFFDKNNVPVFDSPQGIQATEAYAKLLRQDGPFGASSYGVYEASTSFAQGKVAIMYGAGPWGASTFDDPSKSNIIGKWKATQVLAGPAGRFTEGYVHGMMIPKNAPHKEAAWLFIQWFTSSKVQLERALAKGGSGDVTRKSVFENADYKTRYSQGDWAAAQLEAAAKYGHSLRPVWLPQWMQIGDIIGAAVQKVIAGDATAKDALTAAAKDVHKVMQQAGYYKK